MKSYPAIVASDNSYVLGEGPAWDDDRELAAWVDIPAGNVHVGRFDGSSVHVARSHHVDHFATAVSFTDTEDLLVAGQRSLLTVSPTGETNVVVDLFPPNERRRLNDGACDPQGRFLVGSLSFEEPPGTESLYRVEAADQPRVLTMDDDLAMSNGIGWSPDGRTLYTVDTTPGIIRSRPYDPPSGTFGQRSDLITIDDGSPDGLCVDSEGRLWVAVWGPGQIRCFDPHGGQIAVVDVPAPHTTSAAFVGPKLDKLLITTASDELSPDQLKRYPNSGHLFIADVEAVGLPTARWP